MKKEKLKKEVTKKLDKEATKRPYKEELEDNPKNNLLLIAKTIEIG